MAQDLNSPAELSGAEGRRKAAVRTIAESAALRSLLRDWLRLAGLLPLQSPYTQDALETARICGMQQMGLNIIASLNEVDPKLWPALQLEEALSEQT